VWAYKSSGRIGSTAKLRVATEIKSGYLSWVVKVRGIRGAVATIKTPVVKPGLIQGLTWKVPRTLKPQTLTFCAVAYGTNALSSSEACGRLVVTKAPAQTVAAKRPVVRVAQADATQRDP
jgi:hypothetical protein